MAGKQSRISLLLFVMLYSMNTSDGFWVRRTTTKERDEEMTGSTHGFTAAVFGAGHVRTFDGTTYDLPGHKDSSCTYLLTRDRVSRNFTLLGTENSMTLLTPDFAVTIDKSSKVKINNSDIYSNLPVFSYRGTVVVSHQASTILVRTTYGITLRCHKKRSVCLIELESQTRNQTLGLLGTNDFRQSNDMRMRNGQISDNIFDFMNSYEVSGRKVCQFDIRDEVAPRTPSCPRAEHARCRQYFHLSTSPLRTCFSTVDPEPFQLSCEADSSVCGLPSEDSAVCDSVEAYISLCGSYGVDVTYPEHCSKCGKRDLESTWKVSSRKKLDVVIAIGPESLSSASEQSAEYFNSLVHRLKHTLKKSGYTDVRFGLVTQRCTQNVEIVHEHTMHGQLFSAHHFLSHLRETLQRSQIHRCNRVTLDAVESIKVASRYPFRDVAARLVILLAETEPLDTSTRQLLQQRLIQRDIVFSVATRTQSQSQTIGLYRHLARTTGGATYDIDVIRRNSRQHIHDVTQHITETLTSSSVTSNCRQCTCQRDIDGSSYSVCRKTSC